MYYYIFERLPPNYKRLTLMERTVMVRRYIDKMEDNQMISVTDGYTNVDTFFETAIEKISRIKKAGMAL